MIVMPKLISLEDLPSPPAGKTGWPWTEASSPPADVLGDLDHLPKISIVTPSYNQAQYIEETIRSVLLQGYPNLEHIIIDGGSTDGTVDIIRKYEPFIAHWVSEPDNGQSNALNKGFQKATGDFVGWQNSDDFYAPDAFSSMALALQKNPNAQVIYGSVDSVDERSNFIESNPVSEFSWVEMTPWANMFNQSMFFHRVIFENGDFIDESFQHYMDLNYFCRLGLKNYNFCFEPRILAKFRLHLTAKGFTQYDIAAREALAIYSALYKNEDIPKDARLKALDSIRGQCIDCFGKDKVALFKELTYLMYQELGIKVFSYPLFFRYCLAQIGESGVFKAKQVFRMLSNSPS